MNTIEVDFFDTTMRDGAQAQPEEHQFPIGSKPIIGKMIAEMGVSAIEAGFPKTPLDFEQVKEVAQTVGNQAIQTNRYRSGELEGAIQQVPAIVGLTLAIPDHIEKTWEAVKPAANPRTHIFMPTDQDHMNERLKMTRNQVIQQSVECIEIASELSKGNNGVIEISPELATTSDRGFLKDFFEASIQAGADLIRVPDTKGVGDPFFMRELYLYIFEKTFGLKPGIIFAGHNHQDLAMANANSFALVKAADEFATANKVDMHIQIDNTIGGIGERAGNSDYFPMIASMHTLHSRFKNDVVWTATPRRAVRTAEKVLEYAHMTVDRRSPVVGVDIKTHRSGAHADAVVKGGHTMYTPIDPTFWGHESDFRIEDGMYQGRNGRQNLTT